MEDEILERGRGANPDKPLATDAVPASLSIRLDFTLEVDVSEEETEGRHDHDASDQQCHHYFVVIASFLFFFGSIGVI